MISWYFEDTYGNDITASTTITLQLSTTGGTLASSTDTIAAGFITSTGVLLTSSTTVGKVAVTATGLGLTGTVTVTFAGAATDFKLSSTPSAVQIGTTATITVQLIDANGNNALHTYGTDIGLSASATSGTLGAIPVIAVNTGSATFTWTAPAAVPPGGTATITVTATFPGGTTITRQLTIPVTGAPYQLKLSAEPASAPADGTSIVTIKAWLVDAQGATIITPAPGVTINFATTGGTLLTTTASTSPTTGIAATFLRAPCTPGKVNVTASGGGLTGTITIEFTTPPPVYKAEVKKPTLVDTAGRTVTAPTVGRIIAISSPIVNKQNVEQQTLYIVQVKDATGAIVSFNFMSGTIPPNTELTFAISWKPTEPGTYTIEVFAWNNFTEAEVLAPMQTITITVT